jgi:predicted amidophosphoribosyltransferase
MFLAEELVAAIRSSIDIAGKESDYIITNVPRRAASIRRYGYDHSAELAKKVGKLLGIRYMRFLVSKAKKAQKDMVGTQRISNINISYARFNEGLLEGKRVILLDDVVTTGSSMGAAAAMIRALGVKTIIGVTASIAFKDSYVRPPK